MIRTACALMLLALTPARGPAHPPDVDALVGARVYVAPDRPPLEDATVVFRHGIIRRSDRGASCRCLLTRGWSTAPGGPCWPRSGTATSTLPSRNGVRPLRLRLYSRPHST